jgi:hypothetical protein
MVWEIETSKLIFVHCSENHKFFGGSRSKTCARCAPSLGHNKDKINHQKFISSSGIIQVDVRKLLCAKATAKTKLNNYKFVRVIRSKE